MLKGYKSITQAHRGKGCYQKDTLITDHTGCTLASGAKGIVENKLKAIRGCSYIKSYYFVLFWTPPFSHMYDTINEYVISLSEYSSDINLNL